MISTKPLVRYTPNSPWKLHPTDIAVLVCLKDRLWAVKTRSKTIGRVPKSVSIPDFGDFILPPPAVNHPDGVYRFSLGKYNVITEIVGNRLARMLAFNKNYLTGDMVDLEWSEAKELTDPVVDNIITNWVLTGEVPDIFKEKKV